MPNEAKIGYLRLFSWVYKQTRKNIYHQVIEMTFEVYDVVIEYYLNARKVSDSPLYPFIARLSISMQKIIGPASEI